MKSNISSTDRAVRMRLTFFLASLKIYGIVPGIWEIIFTVTTILLMLTARLNYCITYPLKHILSKKNFHFRKRNKY
jgi:hypothetical protein